MKLLANTGFPLNHFVGFLNHFCPVMMTTLSSNNKPYTLNYIFATIFLACYSKNIHIDIYLIDIEQMAEVTKASYSNVVGKTRQQDVIRAQLEIVQLDDRLTSQK
ncbi:hypothetical protein L1273_16775, partial [Pseudoalteromonas sp. DL2-H6]|uniref:hypothetical protein n=1 Tax=Pseudoalteromonas sp. DL2-H6 TaxID=2908890 RepID=UPI001F28558A